MEDTLKTKRTLIEWIEQFEQWDRKLNKDMLEDTDDGDCQSQYALEKALTTLILNWLRPIKDHRDRMGGVPLSNGYTVPKVDDVLPWDHWGPGFRATVRWFAGCGSYLGFQESDEDLYDSVENWFMGEGGLSKDMDYVEVCVAEAEIWQRSGVVGCYPCLGSLVAAVSIEVTS